MNDFQGGVTANDLSPQTYKNSSQTPGIQSTLNSAVIESSNLNQSANTLPTSGTLVVVGPPATLGVSTQTEVQNNSSNFLPLALGVMIISVILAVYFFKNFKISFNPEDE